MKTQTIAQDTNINMSHTKKNTKYKHTVYAGKWLQLSMYFSDNSITTIFCKLQFNTENVFCHFSRITHKYIHTHIKQVTYIPVQYIYIQYMHTCIQTHTQQFALYQYEIIS